MGRTIVSGACVIRDGSGDAESSVPESGRGGARGEEGGGHVTPGCYSKQPGLPPLPRPLPSYWSSAWQLPGTLLRGAPSPRSRPAPCSRRRSRARSLACGLFPLRPPLPPRVLAQPGHLPRAAASRRPPRTPASPCRGRAPPDASPGLAHSAATARHCGRAAETAALRLAALGAGRPRPGYRLWAWRAPSPRVDDAAFQLCPHLAFQGARGGGRGGGREREGTQAPCVPSGHRQHRGAPPHDCF